MNTRQNKQQRFETTGKSEQETASVVTAFDYFFSATYHSGYIIDCDKKTFHHVFTPLPFIEHSAEKLKQMGFDFYRQSVPENEQKLLTTLYADALSFWNTHSSFKPDNYILSCNFHISNGKIKKLINHKIFPVYFDEDNKCKQLACILSLPSSFTFRNIVMCKKKAEHYWEYTPCSTSQLWRKIKRSVLSDAEKDILALANMGYSAKEMSEYLSRSESCIKVRKDKIFQKLGAKNMQEAIAIATAHLYM